jgi:selenide,water dikinase
VDDPETFGAIAVANALSDVYAMGGDPQVALSICGFPDALLPREILTRILQGGREKAAEAGCAIVGGHTVLDPELKYGLCVLGSVPDGRSLSHTGGRAGDRLLLSKPLGLGVAAQAIKKQQLAGDDLERVIDVMTTLNRGARDVALASGSRAATDVTGYGLLGHLHHLALGSGLSARIEADAVPRFDFARGLVDEGHVPGGSEANLAYVTPRTRFAAGVDGLERLLLADAQTSGGLLFAVPPERAPRALAELEERSTLACAVVGELLEGPAGEIEVV